MKAGLLWLQTELNIATLRFCKRILRTKNNYLPNNNLTKSLIVLNDPINISINPTTATIIPRVVRNPITGEMEEYWLSDKSLARRTAPTKDPKNKLKPNLNFSIF
jgi:hypothetical protein